MVELGQKELLVIAYLRKNARMRLTQLSRFTHIPVSTLYDQIARRYNNVISKYTILIDFAKLNYGTRVTVMLRVQKEEKKALEGFLFHHSHVNSLYKINNGYDFMVDVVFSSLFHFEQFIDHIEARFPILETRCYHVIEDLKREEFLAQPLPSLSNGRQKPSWIREKKSPSMVEHLSPVDDSSCHAPHVPRLSPPPFPSLFSNQGSPSGRAIAQRAGVNCKETVRLRTDLNTPALFYFCMDASSLSPPSPSSSHASPASYTLSQPTDNETLNLALYTIEQGKQALVFSHSKRSAEKSAEEIARKLKKENTPSGITSSAELVELAETIGHVLPHPTKQCIRLAYCVERGIAFHHAGLTQKQKELIEDSFREGKIRIICCTPTLAAGVDLPSFRTILKELKRYQAPRGMQWIPVLEYEQMAGRSGRPSYDTFGEAVAVAKTEAEKEEIYDRYVCGVPEEIYSKLAVQPVLRTYLLSLIAAGFVNNKQQLLAFFEKTFWAHQFQDMQKLESIIDEMLALLEEFGFITSSTTKARHDFVSASELSKESLRATLIGVRVAQLYLDPLTAHQMIVALQKAGGTPGYSGYLTSFSFLHLISNRLEMRPLLRIRVKEWETYQARLIEKQDEVLEKEPDVYDLQHDEYLYSIKTASFFADWCDENQEDHLLEKYDIRPGEIRAKLAIADWLLYSGEELAKLLKMQSIVKELMKMRFRMQYGVREELLPLLRLQGIGRVRARLLFNNGIKDLGEVKKADVVQLAQLVGKALALSLKKQVGQELAPEKVMIPEGKRKGQMSLGKYDDAVN